MGVLLRMLVGWFIVDEIHIATIATHPDFRKQGIGENLLSLALQSAKEEGAISSFLEVRESNVAAQNDVSQIWLCGKWTPRGLLQG